MYVVVLGVSLAECADLSFCRPEGTDPLPAFPKELCSPELRQLLSPIFDQSASPAQTLVRAFYLSHISVSLSFSLSSIYISIYRERARIV